jgi:hypothetical protein
LYFILYSKGATLSNRYRLKEFRDITHQSQKLYEDLLVKQEELKQELLNSSSKDSYENILLLNQQSEERIQSKIIYHTGFMLVSASFISLIISYVFNR